MNRFFQTTIMLNEAKKSKKMHSLGMEILIFILLFFIVSMPQAIITSIIGIYYLFTSPSFQEELSNASITLDFSKLFDIAAETTNNMTPLSVIVTLFSTIFMIGGTILYCTKIEKRSLYSMGFSKKNIAFEYLSGVLIGFVMFSLAVLICIATGSMTIEGLNPKMPIGIILLFFIGYIIQGASEEIVCRGYFMISVARNKTLVTAILANSLIFSALHLLNPGVSFLGIFNIVLFGIFASVYILKRGSLWGACAIHSIWNFVQGNLYGIKVSGISVDSSILTSSLDDSGKLFNGGNFGLEGGLAVTIVLIISIIVVLLSKTKKTELFIKEDKALNLQPTTVL